MLLGLSPLLFISERALGLWAQQGILGVSKSLRSFTSPLMLTALFVQHVQENRVLVFYSWCFPTQSLCTFPLFFLMKPYYIVCFFSCIFLWRPLWRWHERPCAAPAMTGVLSCCWSYVRQLKISETSKFWGESSSLVSAAAIEEDGDWWQGSSPWRAWAGASQGSSAFHRARGWVWTSQAVSWCVCLWTRLLVIILGRAEIMPQLWEQPCSHVRGSRTQARRSTPSLRAALVFVKQKKRKKKKAAVLLLLLLKPLSPMPRTACVEFLSTLSAQVFLGAEGAAPMQPYRQVGTQWGPFCSSEVLHRARGTGAAGLAQPFYWGFPSSSHILCESPHFFFHLLFFFFSPCKIF